MFACLGFYYEEYKNDQKRSFLSSANVELSSSFLFYSIKNRNEDSNNAGRGEAITTVNGRLLNKVLF